jgi:YjbE family integral membrane protein
MLEFNWSWDFLLRFLSIALIDLSLSGDNAIVIGMAAASLPRKERKWAIIFGGGLAILLRVLLTTIASLLMTISLLSAVGGLVLFWVAWKLIKMDVEGSEENDIKNTKNFRQAIIIIVTADFMMSLDNVIAVAGTAHGDIVLLILGLLLSMPLLIGTGGAISLLIDRFKWLVFVGAAVICFAGSRMIFEDRFIESRLQMPTALILIISVVIGVALPALFVWLNRKKKKST